MTKQSPFLGAVLLVAGTAIGAGMLGLPVITALGGFVPAAVAFVVTWVVMLVSALMLLEVNMALPMGCNLVSMAEATVGAWGKVLAWASYLLLLYALNAAYLSGISAMLQSAAHSVFREAPPVWVIVLAFIALFSVLVYLGTAMIDRLNRLFIVGLAVAYIALVVVVAPHVQLHQLAPMQWSRIPAALPIMVTAFGFHIVIPSLRKYLGEQQHVLRRAVLIGSALPIVVYLCWDAVTLGVLPLQGVHGLIAMQSSGQPAIDLALGLKAQLHSDSVDWALHAFTFCAITTSFIGVSLSLFDFIIDGLHLPQRRIGRVLAAVITFVPPVAFTLFYPKGFLLALGYGGIFVAVLLIFLPAMMVWFGRKNGVVTAATPSHTFGGRLAPWILVAFSLVVIVTELCG